jgi:hypothetical protein
MRYRPFWVLLGGLLFARLLSYLLTPIQAPHSDITQALFAQRIPGPGGTAPSSGPVAPTFVSATGSLPSTSGSFAYTSTGSVTTVSGDMVFAAFSVHGAASLTYCATLTGATGDGGLDTFTQVAVNNGTGTFTSCVVYYVAFNVHASSSYSVVFQGTSASAVTGNVMVVVFHPGSLTAKDTPNCSGQTGGATSLACSSSMTPTTTLELAVAFLGSYDDTSSGQAANTPFTLPTGGYSAGSSTGGLLFEYYIDSTSAVVTPGFTSIGAGDPLSIVGNMFK